MKKKKAELDVDFIGGQEPLTKEEEKAISKFIRSRKLAVSGKRSRKPVNVSRRKISV